MRKKISKLLVMFMVLNALMMFLPADTLKSVSYGDASSGITITADGDDTVLTINDDFSGAGLNTSIWESTDDFIVTSGVLQSNGSYSNSGAGHVRLKGDYSDYETISMSVELVNVGDSNDVYSGNYRLSNGGFGISGGNKVWIYDQAINYDDYFKDYIRDMALRKYSNLSLSRINTNYREYIDGYGYYQNKSPNASMKLDIDIYENDSRHYYVDMTVYQDKGNGGESNYVQLKRFVKSIRKTNMDLKSIYLYAVEDMSDWQVSFDNFHLEARKPRTFDSLVATWYDDIYKLTWDKVTGATAYQVYYKNGDTPVAIGDAIQANDNLEVYNAYVNDDNPNSNKVYYVTALIGSSSEPSNEIKLYGNISNDFEIKGTFSANDYNVTWDPLAISGDMNYTYVLYHGENEGEVDQTIGDPMAKSVTNRLFEDVQSTSDYYEDYLQLMAIVSDSTYGNVGFRSNIIQMKDEVRLGLNVVNGKFIFLWDADVAYNLYYLFRGNDQASANDPFNLSLPYDVIADVSGAMNDNGIISIQKNLSDPDYLNKFFILVGNRNGHNQYSNVIQAKNIEGVPRLTWSRNANNQLLIKWDNSTFNAEKVELYYGYKEGSSEEIKADDINYKVVTDGNLLQDGQFATYDSKYDNKYIRGRFFIDDVWYYSNIIRTTTLDFTSAQISEVEKVGNDGSLETQMDFEFTWDDIRWPEDGETEATRVSAFEVYYKNGSGNLELIRENYKDNSYRIEDIYDTNSKYLGKEFYVKSVCTVVDQYGTQNTLEHVSEAVIPRKIIFNSLKDDFASDTDRDYTITWSIPVEGDVEEQTITSEDVEYELVMGETKNLADRTTVLLGAPYPGELSQTWADVRMDGTGKEYYHKFFNVKALIENVTYVSNTVYSEDKIVLDVERFGDDFTLKWTPFAAADSVKISYAQTEEDEYMDFEPAKLNGGSVSYTIEDLDDVNKGYNGQYFKIAAVLDGHEVVSNAVKLDVTLDLPSIEGEYQGDGSFLITWKDVDWEQDKYLLFYRNDTTVNDITTSVYKEMTTLASNVGSDYEATIGDVASSDYKEKFVRVAAVDGHLKVFSNRVYVEDPTIKGQLNDKFSGEDADIKVGNRKEIVLTYKVYKEMYQPYLKLDFTGSKYLTFNKMSAVLQKKDDKDFVTIEVNLITETDEETGNVTAFIHPTDEAPMFLPDEEYVLTFNTALSLNENHKDDVYTALKAYGNQEDKELKEWAMPYYITRLNLNEGSIDEGLNMKIGAHWNIVDSESSGDERQIFRELFNVEIDVRDKQELPGSL